MSHGCHSHPVSFREVCDFRTDLLDEPGSVRASYVGKFLDEVAERLDLPVDGVECGGGDLNEKVLWAGGRYGALADNPLVTLLVQKKESFMSSGGHGVVAEVAEGEGEVSEVVDVGWRTA